MNGINLKGFEVRSFMIRGLTAKWGIGENRVPSIWDANLIGYWDARDLPNGKVSTIANKATLATKAPDLAVTGATMADGTLQFDGVNDEASTAVFLLPEKFTMLWDIDWLGDTNTENGLRIPNTAVVANKIKTNQLKLWLGAPSSTIGVPNTVVGFSTDNYAYNKDGTRTAMGLTVGTDRTPQRLYVGHSNRTDYTKMVFRSLYIFNRELAEDEMTEALAAMFS